MSTIGMRGKQANDLQPDTKENRIIQLGNRYSRKKRVKYGQRWYKFQKLVIHNCTENPTHQFNNYSVFDISSVVNNQLEPFFRS